MASESNGKVMIPIILAVVAALVGVYATNSTELQQLQLSQLRDDIRSLKAEFIHDKRFRLRYDLDMVKTISTQGQRIRSLERGTQK